MKIGPGKNKFLWFVIVVLFVLVAVIFGSISAATGMANPRLFITPSWIEKTPTPNIPELPRSEAEKYQLVATQFPHPATRITIEEPYTAQSLLTQSDKFDLSQVAIHGKVVSIQRINRLLADDWQTAYLLTVDDGSTWIQVLYRGYVEEKLQGKDVLVSGLFAAAGPAIHADLVQVLERETHWHHVLPPSSLLAFGLVVLIGLIAVFMLIKRKLAASFLISILLLSGLTACDFQVETIIRKDETATTMISLSEDHENIEFLRRIPGLGRYIQSWITQLRSQGMTVENWISGDLEYLAFSQNHPDLASLTKLDEMQPFESWVFATSYEEGDAQCYRYMAVINPSKLSTTSPGTDPNAEREIRSYISNANFAYAVSLPGVIRYANTKSIRKNRAEWRLDMERQNELIAESCYKNLPQTINPIWFWVLILGIGVVDLGLWTKYFLSLSISPNKS